MKLAILTCQKLPNGIKEDLPLYQSLSELKIETDFCIWNEENDWSKYDACLLRSVWDYHDNLQAFNDWLNQVNQLSQIINPVPIIQWNQNKNYLADLQAFGITVAPTQWLKSATTHDLEQLCVNQPHNTFFLKPVIGADSSGTLRFKNDTEGLTQAQNHLNEWLPQVDMMLQPYLKSVESFGETSIIYINGNFTHAVRKIPVSGDYRVQDTFGATDVVHQPNAAELSLSKACIQYITQQFEMPMYARFDFLHDDQGNVFLNEAEVIEPSLFFHHCPSAARQLANTLKSIIHHQDLAD